LTNLRKFKERGGNYLKQFKKKDLKKKNNGEAGKRRNLVGKRERASGAATLIIGNEF